MHVTFEGSGIGVGAQVAVKHILSPMHQSSKHPPSLALSFTDGTCGEESRLHTFEDEQVLRAQDTKRSG